MESRQPAVATEQSRIGSHCNPGRRRQRVGKTTSIAKIANLLQKNGNSIVLAAGDTFRAAAVEQLTMWSERLGCDIVRKDSGADPASVAYEGATKAVDQNADYLIVDTAGRLQTQKT